MRVMIRNLIGFLGVGLVPVLLSPAMAQWNPGGTPAEQAQLPQVCAVKLRNDDRSAEGQRYLAQFGADNWVHMHHYCYGRVFLLRAAQASTKRDQDYQRSLAVKEFSYVLKAAKPDFWMRPQLNLELGRVHLLLGQAAQATALFSDAIRLNPHYQPAYLALISELRSKGQQATALTVAEEGLRHLPNSAELKKLYFELGGKEPLPTPARAATTGRGAGRDAPPEATRADTSQAESAATERKEAGDSEVAEENAPSEASPASSGQSRNCRFCPPDEVEERWREGFRN
ncbi:hypothetical protein ACFQ4M_04980 [Thauera mechernichensis]|uniref:Tetratricopeptide repeat protein n=2 Tax=Thauera TaxID=33057 RepID=A0ABW3WA33_9RHOO|nr:hypothetical protein [Thauera mechernichensis]ENO82577.1 TPR repeat-containing protein [Thauera sp. 27]MDG3065915.1 hypothetical protein [Thauera mechernichensis]HAG74664.1 hypothetical protein [Thauera sp.]